MPIFSTGFEAGSKDYYNRSGWNIEDDLSEEYTHRRDGFGGRWCCSINQSGSRSLFSPVDTTYSGRWAHYWLDRGREETWGVNFLVTFRKGGGSQFSVGVADDGTVNLYRGTNTLVASSGSTVDMTTGHWFAVEMVVANSGGLCNVYIDDAGSPIVTFSGDTQANNPSVGSNWDQIEWGTSGGGAPGYVDDIIVTDVSEGRYNESFGKRVPLDSDQSTGLTPSAGSSNFINVATFDTSTYNFTSTATTEDLYGSSGNIRVGDVRFVSVGALLASQADFQAQTAIHSGSTTSYGTLTAAGSSGFGGILSFHLVDPDTSVAWTQDGINALQAGVRSGT